jgi:pimeloyl-ACP methyl ester carboxylesterase
VKDSIRLTVMLALGLAAGCTPPAPRPSTARSPATSSPASTPPPSSPAAVPAPTPGVREGKWQVRGTRLFVRDVGPETAPVLVVVHGGPGGNHLGLRPLEALAPERRVILYDQRGTGESDRLPISTAKPEGLGRLSLEENVADLEAIRARLGRDRIALIGHSWGGALAVFYAAAHPEHVEKLVVYSGGPETPELAAKKQLAHKARLSEEDRDAIVERMGAMKGALGRGAPQEELDRLFVRTAAAMFPSLYCRRPAPGSAPAGAGRGGFWANQAAGAYVDTFAYASIADALKKVDAPALLLWGRCEPSPRERLTNLQGLLRGARFVAFEHSGHNAMEEEGPLFFETLRAFLAGRPLPRQAPP